MKNFDRSKILGQLKAMPARNLFSAMAAVVVVLLLVDFFLVARPQVAAIMALHDKVGQLRTSISALSDNKQRLPKFRVTLDDARLQVKDFDAMVHREGNMPAVFRTISTLANEYGVKIDQLVPQKSDGVVLVKNADGAYSSLSILVQGRAGYHDLGRFLTRLQKESLFWQLESFNIISDERGTGKHGVKMQMKILVLGG